MPKTKELTCANQRPVLCAPQEREVAETAKALGEKGLAMAASGWSSFKGLISSVAQQVGGGSKLALAWGADVWALMIDAVAFSL